MTTEVPVNQPSTIPLLRRARRGRVALRVLIYICTAYVAWCVALYFFQDHLLFPADMAPAPATREDRYDRRTSVIRLPIETGGEVVAWFVPAPRAGDAQPAPVAIFFHGNAEIIDYLDEIVDPYRKLGLSVYLPEYRGYGRSAGKPDEAGMIGDAVRFYDELVKRPDVDKERIVIHGRSLGGGPACALASQRPCRALVLQSVFTSAADMAKKYFAPGFLAKHPFHNDRILPTLDVPVFISHGTYDEIIPVAHARTLAGLARHATLVEYPCTHNGFPGEGKEEDYWQRIEAFLRDADALPK
jgi:fermentation-respiration switch protein FrsA (DUF1100 family)